MRAGLTSDFFICLIVIFSMDEIRVGLTGD